jgi:hypothetical protein
MMPGSERYTPEEWDRVCALVRDAADAADYFTADDLEDAQRELEHSQKSLAEGTDR